MYVNDIKTKKALRYLSAHDLRAGRTHQVWQNLELVSATPENHRPNTKESHSGCTRNIGILKIGKDAKADWGDVCGPCCNVIETNERRLRLLEYAIFKNLVLTNTFGPNKASRRWTWQTPQI